MPRASSSANNFSVVKINKGSKSVSHFLWLLIIAALVFFINYQTFGTLYLRCIFKELTGYDCPACGTQRAVVSLFKGEFKQAFWYNPYLILLTPGIATILIRSLFNKDKNWIKKESVYFIIAILGILMIAWTIIRNLPIWKEFVEL